MFSRPRIAASSLLRHPHDFVRPSANACQNTSFRHPQSQRQWAIIMSRLPRLSLRIPTTTSRPKRRPILSLSVISSPFLPRMNRARRARTALWRVRRAGAADCPPTSETRHGGFCASQARVRACVLRHSPCGAPLQRVRSHAVKRGKKPRIALVVVVPHKAHSVPLHEVLRNPCAI